MNKRIGIDCRLWNETGVGRYIRNLVTQLATVDSTNEYILFLRKKEFLTVSMPGANFHKVLADIRWHSIREQVQFPQILYKAHVDLMHFPYFSLPFAYKKKFIITIHDLILHHFPTGQASTLPKPLYMTKLYAYRFLTQYAAHHAERIITVSEATKQEIRADLHIDPRAIAVTYEGISSELAVVRSEKRTIPEPYFLYVGNAYPHKNLERLLDAFQLVQEKNTDIKLVFVGKDDFFYNRLKKKVTSLQLAKQVTFLHTVPDTALAGLYHHALALVMPSLMEGFGLPALEAMAQECLVVASDIPVMHEICSEAAVYIKQHNVQDIAKQLEHIAKAPDAYEHMKKIGKKRVQLFSWEKMAKETKTIYESCFSI